MFVSNAHQEMLTDGRVTGQVGEALVRGCSFDTGLMRPYFTQNGQQCVTVNTGRKDPKTGLPIYKQRTINELRNAGIPTINATTAIRKDEWKLMDRAVVMAARERLRAWSDLAAVSSFAGFNGMSKMILEHETMSDPGEAAVDMDGLSHGMGDQPQFELEGLPLPITHVDFHYSARRMAVSRDSGTPLDLTHAEAAGRRVAEKIESTLIGTATGLTYGVAADYNNTPQVYGYTTHPDRSTKTDITTPDGTNGSTTLQEVLTMIELARTAKHYGPYMLYHSTDWDKWLDDDYRAQDSRTLRQRLRAIEGIQDVRRLDFLSSTYTLLLVQMTSEVAQAVTGMPITTVQWQEQGGMQLCFKVMAIMCPRIRSDYYGNSGIVHGTTA